VQGHRRHVAKLEQIVRLMDNDLLDPDKIDEVRVCYVGGWVGGWA
jgi:CCR4-NOT transcriptional regulation complex NOT5 subunit